MKSPFEPQNGRLLEPWSALPVTLHLSALKKKKDAQFKKTQKIVSMKNISGFKDNNSVGL